MWDAYNFSGYNTEKYNKLLGGVQKILSFPEEALFPMELIVILLLYFSNI